MLHVLVICLFPVSALAQSEELDLRLTRDFGYGAGGQIQGKFSLRVGGPEDIVQVDFIMDGEVIHTATEPPFRFQFDTDDYPPGVHTMTAVGYKADGTAVNGPEFVRQFLSADDAKSSTMKIIVPLLILVGIATLVGGVGPGLDDARQRIQTWQLWCRRRCGMPTVYIPLFKACVGP